MGVHQGVGPRVARIRAAWEARARWVGSEAHREERAGGEGDWAVRTAAMASAEAKARACLDGGWGGVEAGGLAAAAAAAQLDMSEAVEVRM